MTEEEEQLMGEDIALELLRTGMGLRVNIDTGGVRLNQLVQVPDTLTSVEFLGSVNGMRRAVYLAKLVLDRHIRKASGKLEPLTSVTEHQSSADAEAPQPERTAEADQDSQGHEPGAQ